MLVGFTGGKVWLLGYWFLFLVFLVVIAKSKQKKNWGFWGWLGLGFLFLLSFIFNMEQAVVFSLWSINGFGP